MDLPEVGQVAGYKLQSVVERRRGNLRVRIGQRCSCLFKAGTDSAVDFRRPYLKGSVVTAGRIPLSMFSKCLSDACDRYAPLYHSPMTIALVYCSSREILEVDPLTCPKCKGPMRVIAVIDDREVIRKILDHLGLWEVKPKPPPSRTKPQNRYAEPDISCMKNIVEPVPRST